MASSVATPRTEPPEHANAVATERQRNVPLLSLSAPIDQQRQPQFLQEVAAELEASGPAGEIGEGSVHRLARQIQRRFFDPPQLPNASKAARA